MAMEKLAVSDHNLDFLTLFAEACREILSLQCSVGIDVGTFEEHTIENLGRIDIVSTVGVTAPNFSGSVTIAFPRATFLNICERMLGEKMEDINSENQDLASELLNMMFGHTKAKYHNTRGASIQPAIPVIIQSPDMRLGAAHDVASLRTSFSGDLGIFYAIVSLRGS